MSEVVGQTGLFGEVAFDLLQGQFICRQTREAAYEYLSDDINLQGIDLYLRRMGITVRCSTDGQVFYVAYLEVDGADRRAAIRQQFRETINYIEPLVSWLGLVMSSQRTTSALSPGDVVSEGSLLAAIEAAPALVDELNRLSSMSFFKVRTDSPKQQLSKMLDALCNHGYLVPRTSKGSVYLATGKWAYLYEVLAFIAEHENIDIAVPEAPQQELLP